MSSNHFKIRVRAIIEVPNELLQRFTASASASDGWPADSVEFGAAVCRARQLVGLSQAELAQKVGVTDVTIRNIEKAKHPCRPELRAWIVTTLTRHTTAPETTERDPSIDDSGKRKTPSST